MSEGEPRPERPHRPAAKRDAARRLRQADRLARVLRVLTLIQGRGRWDAEALARELDCSVRTVYRDLAVLELAGIPWTYDAEARSYRVREDYRFPVANLSDDELLGLATATAFTETPGLDVTSGAGPVAEKIAAKGNARTGDLLASARGVTMVLGLGMADHSRHREVIRTVQRALVDKRQVRGVYESPYGREPKEIVLHPYRLCLVKTAWYVVGRAEGQGGPYTYRVLRFRSLEVRDAPADVPEGFDLTAYFGNAWTCYRSLPPIEVELLFTGVSAFTVLETIWHRTQRATENPDGTTTLVFTVDGLVEVVRWIAGWTGAVRVVRPEGLRKLMIGHYRQAIEAQGSDP